MFKYAFVAVFSFALGVLVKDVAEDFRKPTKPQGRIVVEPFPASLVVPLDAVVCQDTGGKPKCRTYVSKINRKELAK